jgi:hypothetical protein
MKYLAKACTSKKYRRSSGFFITVVGLLSCFGFVMLIYEFIAGNVLFGISYTIATLLGFTYVLIRINTVFATYIAADKNNVYMKNWANDFLPYDADSKIKLLSEFVPAKTKVVEIPIHEISKIAIGTKNFIKRNIGENSTFPQAIKRFETSRDYYKKKTVSSMDLFYIETVDGGCYYMPIDKFETSNIVKLIKGIQKFNPNIDLRVNSRDYRSLRTK